ncbi:hypothetical protein C8R43DRAFT_1141059 [Mycena crocata]|nr:hypothetical protein C8R43DRAFT_1141059 [Mycena crocata]
MHLPSKFFQALLNASPLLQKQVVSTPGSVEVGLSTAAQDTSTYFDFGRLLDGEIDGTHSLDPIHGQCIPLSAAQFVNWKQGYALIVNHLAKVDGYLVNGGVTDPATGDSSLLACFGMGSAPVPVKSLVEKVSQGNVTGAPARVTLGFTSGMSTTTSMTTTKSSTIGVGVSATLDFDIGAASGSATTEVTHSVTNEQSKGFTVTQSFESEDSISLEAPANSECHLQFKVTTCTTRVAADIPVTAIGDVWFSKEIYNGKNYKFELELFPGLQAINPSVMRLDGSVSTRSASNYQGVCRRLA